MLKVISGNKDAYLIKEQAEKEKKRTLTEHKIMLLARAALAAMSKFEQTGDRWALMRACYSLLEICFLRRTHLEFSFYVLVFDICGLLTPREYMLVHPPTKEYQGDKYECKDYFSTMSILQKWDRDKPMGTNFVEFLYEYYNQKSLVVAVQSMMATSEAHRKQTGRDILDDFAESLGHRPLTKYRKYVDAKGKQVMMGNDGSVARVVPHRHLHIVKMH